ncbi:histidine phosphatase family protein [Photobacterium swingsii]|uniref:histidine phosphatase family protein n=1 Tax=Photobacterium swingsii TaxID=680026 RepID=UPI00352D0243
MEIILIRHGKPTGATNPKLTAREFALWVRKYNHSEIVVDSEPPEQLKAELHDHYVVSSDLRRSVHSAIKCLSKEPEVKLKNLREFDIPRYKIPFLLRANHWLILSRILWLLGITSRVESYKDAKSRAKDSALTLAALAEDKRKLAVFGHGLVNRAIARELEKCGWSCINKSSSYWGVTRLKL